jgi:ribose 5-phosphate isomerase A
MTPLNFSSSLIAKKAAGQAAAQLIENHMCIGLGTGSTATFFIEALAQRCQKEGLSIKTVATSKKSAEQAQQLGLNVVSDQEIDTLDITVDGADEIDSHKNMIKGGGGALLREKILAKSSREMIVIVDENKLVQDLGAFPVPVEIAAFAYRSTLLRLTDQGYRGNLRLSSDGAIFVTDNGNYIFDIQFEQSLTNPQLEHERICTIAGVIETGLFFHIAGRIIVGYQDGLAQIQND